MKIESNIWQRVPGTADVEFFPIITKPSVVSSNCYIFAAPESILIIDPGANHEQTELIGRVVSDALALSHRPVLIFLTHCHQDHSQEAGALELPANTEIRRFAHEAGVEALQRGDRDLTVNYLYPWRPEICRARFDGRLFASVNESQPIVFEFSNTFRVPLHDEPIQIPNGDLLKRQWMPFGRTGRLEIYHTPGHSKCSISLQIGSILALGDLPFTANPGLCGLNGWDHADFMETLRKMDWLLETAGITVCCPGHGYCLPAESMREKLRILAREAGDFSGVLILDEDRITSLKNYVDELLEESTALFTILSGRLYTVSFYLSALEEQSAADRVLGMLNMDWIESILSEFRRFVQAFNAGGMPEITVVLKGAQLARSLQEILSEEHVSRLLGLPIVGRAKRLLFDFLGALHGLQFLNTEEPTQVNHLISQILSRAKSGIESDSSDLLHMLDNDQSFLDGLTRRLAAHSLLRDIEFEFDPAPQLRDANVGAERLDHILTTVMEGMAGAGASQIKISTEIIRDHVVIRLSTQQPVSPDALGYRRLNLYNRMLGWLGGSLEFKPQPHNTELLIRLVASESC